MLINIKQNVSIASFVLYDPTRSLAVTGRGASGNVIQLDSVTHGLRIIDDPSTLVYLGYGFENPRPGPWRVTIRPTIKTPAAGTDFAIMAQLRGGTTLTATTGILLPKIEEPVELTARLELSGETLPARHAQILARVRNHVPESIPFTIINGEVRAVMKFKEAGLHGIDVMLEGLVADSVSINRVSFLSVEVQPAKIINYYLIFGSSILLLILFFSRGCLLNAKFYNTFQNLPSSF